MDYKVTREKFLDKEQRNKLMRTCKEKAVMDKLYGRKSWIRKYMIIDIALFTGLRVAEIADLQMKDLKLIVKQPYLTVQRGKGGKKRDVYLSDRLTKHLKRYLEFKKEFGESTENNFYLFPGRNENKPSVFTIMQSIKTALDEAGLSEYTAHATRHSYAVHLLDKTGDLVHVKEQLGHSNLSTTSVYLSVLPEKNGVLANMIDRDEEID